MAKFDPTITGRKPLERKELRTHLRTLVNNVQRDERSRMQWDKVQSHFLRRRYTQEFRNTNFPWPGASDIVMPTIDIAIEDLKPLFIQSTIGTRPVITLVARRPEALQQVPRNEMFMDWLVESRSPHFAREVTLAADHYLQHGFCVYKVWYDYQTRLVREVVTKDKLPDALRQLLPNIDLTEDEADLLQATRGVTTVTSNELAAARPQLEEVLSRHFDLDREDEADMVSIKALVDWVVKGAKDHLVIRKRDVMVDSPRIEAKLPEDLVVNSSVTDIQSARRITEKRFMPVEEFKRMARDRKWNKLAADRAVEQAETRGQINPIAETGSLRAVRDHIAESPRIQFQTNNLDLMEVWEVYTYYDIDGDGIDEKVMITLAPGAASINDDEDPEMLQMIELPYDHGKWPYVKINFEDNEPKYYRTRGLPQRLDDLDVEITTQHRAKLNRMTIANAPVFLYKAGAGIRPENMRWIPGQGMPVPDVAQIAPFQFPNLDFSFEREEQVLQGWVERTTGSINQTLRDQDGLTRPRTAQEIRSVVGLQAQTVGSRLLLWHKGMADVYNMMWDLWHQFGPEEVFVRVTGANEEDLTRFSRADAQGDYEFVPTPAALNNPQQRVSAAQAQLEVIVGAATLPPEMIGDEYELKVGGAVEILAQSIDPRNAQRVIRRRTPEEVQQVQQARAAAAQQAGTPTGALEGPPGVVGEAASRAAQQARAGQRRPELEA